MSTSGVEVSPNPLDIDAGGGTLRERYQALADAEPGLRIRTMANRLGVAELELLRSGCGDLSARPLIVSPQELLRALPDLNEVMAVTRNPWCVHECTGRYEGVRAERQVGLVTSDTIDLRIYFNHWHSIWAVNQPDRRSIQFFDRSGTAVHKVYATPQTNMADFEALIERHLGPDCDEDLVLQPYPPTAPLEPPADPAGLRAGWLAMTETHQFFPLLQRFQVGRLPALQAVGPDLAQRIPTRYLEDALRRISLRGLGVVCYVSNRGVVQIYTGALDNLSRTGEWVNVLDARFNLHLNIDHVDSVWVVNKPTEDGWVTALEAYAEGGELIVQFLAARKPGKPELRAWRDLLVGLCDGPLAV